MSRDPHPQARLDLFSQWMRMRIQEGSNTESVLIDLLERSGVETSQVNEYGTVNGP